MPRKEPAWRTNNIGRILFSAADLFVRQKLQAVHDSGFVAATETQMALFQNLDLKGTRLTIIAARASMTKQSMLELVDKAERIGFVKRQPDRDDKRAKKIVFTQTGLKMLERLRKGTADAERRMTLVTGAAFVARLKSELAVYVEAMQAQGVAPASLKMSGKNATWRLRGVGRILFMASDAFVRDMLRAANKPGQPPIQDVFLVLLRNLELDGSRLTNIAVRSRMTKQAMMELVDKAEGLGFVRRKIDPTDRRSKLIVFTPKGLRMLTQLRGGIARAEGRMAQIIGKKFVAEMKEVLSGYATEAVRNRNDVPAFKSGHAA